MGCIKTQKPPAILKCSRFKRFDLHFYMQTQVNNTPNSSFYIFRLQGSLLHY